MEGLVQMPGRTIKTSKRKARKLSGKFSVPVCTEQLEERIESQENEYITSLLDSSDHKVTDADVLKVLKLLKARLDVAAQKAGLR